MKLLDAINRHQILIEGVKNWHVADIRQYLRALVTELTALLRNTGLDTLSAMTARQFANLMKKVRDLETKTLTNYGNDFVNKLKGIVRSDFAVQRAMFSSFQDEPAAPDVTAADAWQRVRTALIPADGLTVQAFVTGFAAQAMETIERAIRQGYADRLTVEDVVRSVVGNASQRWKDGAIGRVYNQAASMIRTAIQHAVQQTQDMIAETVSDFYVWLSVIDGVTSHVCRDRNGTVYRRGEGPIPPAHRNCRSRTMPAPGSGLASKPPGFWSWIRGQSPEFLADVYGETEADSIRDGSADAAKYGAFQSARELTLAQFEARTTLLTR